MAMSPRILLFSAVGISLYLGLSLYHGHQLKKHPDLQPGAGKGLSARAEEKTWVQVSTTKQVTAGPVQPQGVQGQPGDGSDEAAAPGAYGDQLIATDQLQAELKEARVRAAIAEGELERARLKAEAMFRYGQEQSRLLAPSRREVEELKTRLQETRDKLRQAEQQVADLSNRELLLRKELADLRRAGREVQAPAAPAGGAGGPTPAAERAD